VYTWDAANRLVVSANVDGVVNSFEYDGSGNRTAQSVDGVTTEYVLDVGGELPEVIVATVGGASTRYVQVQGQVLAQQDSGAWTHILPDHLGSVRQLVGSDSRVYLVQSYDPFGVPFETSGSGESDFGYTGEWWDSEAGLLYLRARYYDPGVGRLLSKDRFSGDSNRPQTLSGWDYVENNPTNLVDSTGFYSMKEIKGFFHNAPTYLDVLRYFEPGGHLEGRWGWLKVLRKAEDGDRILVIMNSLNYCGPGVDVCIISPDCLANISPIREDVSGVFQKTENMLMVIPEYPHSTLSHFEVALEGDRYQIQKNTHVLHNYPYPGMDYYDPLIESWEWKADAIATQKYVGLRHDPALASFGGAMSSLAGIIAPDSVEELLAIAEQVFDEAIRNGMVDAQGEFTQEVSMQLMKQLAKRLDPKVLAATELLDLALDINELKTDLGFIVAP
jgi:RHS repeat-associated protein